MKALKCALAISLALNLVLAAVLWRNAMTSRSEESSVSAVSEMSAVDPLVNEKPWSEMHAPRPIGSTGMEKASLSPRREKMDEGPPLPPNPYAVPAWDDRMPNQKGMIDKGLYVVPQTQDNN